MSPGPTKQFDVNVALDQALQVFWKRGYEATSMSELMSEMGIGKKSLYDTFGNKRALFLNVVDRYANLQFAEITALLRRPGSALSNLKALLRKWEQLNTCPGSIGCLWGNNIADFDDSDEEVADRLSRHLQRLEDLLYATLRQAKSDGEVNVAVHPRDTARMLVSLGQGMALIGRVRTGAAFYRSSVNAVLKMIEKR